MPVIIKLTFLAGRYHATPWGRHVNEGTPEWPPSPWRLLRALIAVWKRTCPEFSEQMIRRVLEPLAHPPRFHLPPCNFAHTRHYMPLGKKSPLETAGGGTTLVFDTFVSISRQDPLLVGWPGADLSTGDQTVLSKLLENLSSLGRAESWVQAELFDGMIELPLGQATEGDASPVPVFCPDPATAFSDQHYPTLNPKKLAKGTVSPSEFLFDCPRWHLCIDTETIHSEKWSTVPGAKWVNYTRPRPTSSLIAKPRERQKPILARFLLDGPVLPLVEETLPLAEYVRRHLMGRFKRVRQECEYGKAIPPDAAKFVSQVFAGKDTNGQPLKGHRHAYYLPSDDDGDGRIDHFTVYAEEGFDANEVAALDRLRQLPWENNATLVFQIVGLGNVSDFRVGVSRESAVWLSATPFIASRYPKWRGRNRDDAALRGQQPVEFARVALHEEINRLRHRRDGKLPSLVGIDVLEGNLVGVHKLRRIQFMRSRTKVGDNGSRHAWGAFRIIFDEPVCGPICLGKSSHFGMGLFLPCPLSVLP